MRTFNVGKTNSNGEQLAGGGSEGKALISKNEAGLRQDNVFVSNEVKMCKDIFDFPTRKGYEKAIFSNGKLVNMVGASYGHLPNLNFFGVIENQLLEADIKVMTRSINRDDRAFSVEHILNDERYAVHVKNSNDTIMPMLSFCNSYDGSAKTQGRFGYFRTVCENGNYVSKTEIGFSMKHRGDIEEIVIPKIATLIQQFMDNEYYTILKKFEVLAECPIKNVKDYVKLICDKTGIFQFEKSKENSDPSLNAQIVIDTINAEARMLKTDANLWLGYQGFNAVLFKKMSKSFNTGYNIDAQLFELALEMAEN